MFRYSFVAHRARLGRIVVCLGVVAGGLIIGAGSAQAATAKSFRRAADKICTSVAKELANYDLENAYAGLDAQEALDRTRFAVDAYTAAADRLERLEPPKKLASDFEQFVFLRRERLRIDEEALDAIREENQEAHRALGPRYDGNTEAQRQVGKDLGFKACAQRLSGRERSKVEAILEETFLEGDPAFCTEKYTEAFVKVIGGLETCETEEQNPANAAASIEFEDMRGIDKVFASAVINLDGAAGPATLRVDLLYDDGVYKRDNIGPEGD